MEITPLIYVAGKIVAALERQDFSISQVTNYHEVIAELRDAGKPYLTPNMDPDLNDFTPDTCVWYVMRRRAQFVGAIGARRDSLGGRSLGQFWRSAMSRQYLGSSTAVIVDVDFFVDTEVTGTVTYFGDLYFAPEFRGFGDHLRLFTMFCQVTAALHWRSDWSYSFISFDRAEQGGAFTYGFAKTIPGAQVWSEPIANRQSTECCVISSFADITQIAKFYQRNPDLLRAFHDPDPAPYSPGPPQVAQRA